MERSKRPGMLSREEFTAAVGTGEIDTVLTVFPDLYGRLVGKRHTGRYFLGPIRSWLGTNGFLAP